MALENPKSGVETANFRAKMGSRFVSTFRDRPTSTIREGAQALLRGELGAWVLFTDGLIVNGANHAAVEKLLRVKGVDQAKIDNGSRPLVSVLPDREHRQGLIDVERHTDSIVRRILEGPDDDMLTPEGHPLFYRVFAGDASYLQPPLVQIDETTGARTIVLLWHNNKHLKKLDTEMRKLTLGEAVLLTGSSANKTGQSQPVLLRDLDPSVAAHVDFTVNARDAHTHMIHQSHRSSIPMIDLTTTPPVIRREGMYDALPNNQNLQRLLQSDIQPTINR
jgi:tRNA A37 threonylcarbamoyladenosine synthetase subunit TsaC/SUA5/YrdC